MLVVGTLLILVGYLYENPYYYHIGVGVNVIISYSTYLNYKKRGGYGVLRYGFTLLFLWYMLFEYAAWLSSEAWWSDAILRGLGVAPIVYILGYAIASNESKK